VKPKRRSSAMYKSIRVCNFKCFERVDVNDLKRLNVFVGKNGVGKTALLEAIFLHSVVFDPCSIHSLEELRGVDCVCIDRGIGGWVDVFFNGCLTSKVIEITSVDNELNEKMTWMCCRDDDRIEVGCRLNGEKYLKSEWGSAVEWDFPIKKAYFVSDNRISCSELSKLFSRFKLRRRDNVVLNALREIDNRIMDLDIIVNDIGIPILCADIGVRRPIPLQLLGGGVERVANIILSLVANDNDGVLVIDGIEKDLHHSVIGKVLWMVYDLARQSNMQVFLTTQNWECLESMCRVFSERRGLMELGEWDIGVFRLERDGGGVRVVSYDEELFETSVGMNIEIR
jgi:hypothetical protein